MGEAERKDEELYSTVDREAADEAERRDSKVLYQALKDRRGELGGQGQIPAEDRQLSEKILADARQRSAELSAGRARSAPAPAVPGGRPIPWWLIAAWILAIAALVAAWRWLG